MKVPLNGTLWEILYNSNLQWSLKGNLCSKQRLILFVIIGYKFGLDAIFLITPFEKSHWSLADGMNRIANPDLLYSFV